MHLRYITCSDPREFNDIHDVVKLAQLSPRVEIAVQAHPSKMSPGMPRNEWFRELLQYVIRDKYNINLAVHVNREWCEKICRKGQIPQELKEFFGLRTENNKPLIKRWQLNVPSYTVPDINYRALKRMFNKNSQNEFIVQYNAHTKDVATTLYAMNVRFSVLYDASGGRGISPELWNAPLWTFVSQGYSGGLSPENVESNLDKISKVAVYPFARYDKNNNIVRSVEMRKDIWVDAEGKLKTDDKFDILRAQQYVLNVEHWLTKQKQK